MSLNQVGFRSYGNYSSSNYGVNAMKFTDARGNDFYFSYRTLVAFRTSRTGLVVIKNYWGPTTGKHLNWIDDGDKHGRLSEVEFKNKYEEAFGEELKA